MYKCRMKEFVTSTSRRFKLPLRPGWAMKGDLMFSEEKNSSYSGD